MAAAVVLCFLIRGEGSNREVLLGYKKTGFGTGKVVGIGGHLEPGETAAVAVCREVAEETTVLVRPDRLIPAGTVTFRFPAQPLWDMDSTVFVAYDWEGKPVETTEIRPEWHPVAELPLVRMWADAEHWLPPMLAGRMLDAVVTLAADNESVHTATLTER